MTRSCAWRHVYERPRARSWSADSVESEAYGADGNPPAGPMTGCCVPGSDTPPPISEDSSALASPSTPLDGTLGARPPSLGIPPARPPPNPGIPGVCMRPADQDESIPSCSTPMPAAPGMPIIGAPLPYVGSMPGIPGVAADMLVPIPLGVLGVAAVPGVPVMTVVPAHDLYFDPIPDHPTVINFRTKY